MGAACSSVNNQINSSIETSTEAETNRQKIDESSGQKVNTRGSLRVSFEDNFVNNLRNTDSRTMPGARDDKTRKKRTFSVIQMERHDLLELRHPEMKNVLEDFDNATEKIPTMHDKSYLDDIITLLQDKFMNNFKKYSEPDQRELMGDHLAKIHFVTVIVNYYQFILSNLELDAITEADIMIDDQSDDDDDTDDEDEDMKRIIRHIRNILWNYSDSSQRLGEEIANSKMFVFLVKDLQKMSTGNIENIEEDNFAFSSAVNIIGNCARSQAPLSCYTVNIGTEDNPNKVEIVQCLLPVLEKSKSEFVRLQTLLVLSHIVNENQFQYLTADDNLLNFLINMIDAALKAKDRRHDGFSVEELLSGLSGMARNEDIVTKIMELPQPFPLIKEVILMGIEKEQIEACSILHKTAFKKANKDKIMNDSILWKKLHDLQDSNNEDLSEVAKIACFTINDFKKEKEKTIDAQSLLRKASGFTQEKPKYIMISYCQSNMKTVLEIYNTLVTHKFKVWMDKFDLGGESLLDEMSKAVENASIVLICYSEDYFFSKNCRTEAEYAYHLNKDKMFVRLQYKYSPRKWLGAICGIAKYYDFSGHYDISEKTMELVRDMTAKFFELAAKDPAYQPQKKSDESAQATAIKPAIKPTPQEPVKHTQTHTSLVFDKWTRGEMDVWLKKHNLEKFAGLKTLSGEQLTFLYKVFQRAPEFFYRCIEQKLGLKSLDELMRFSNAVEKLSEEMQIIYSISDDAILH